MAKIIENRFDPRNTKPVIIHDGRFHADDMLFAAMAMYVAEKYKNKLELKRLNTVPEEYDEFSIAGDLGLGIYDHHADLDGTKSLGNVYDTETHTVAACGLLYRDIKDMLFPGDSETKKVFEAFINVIEHCDNTSDNNTFSDSINLLFPIDESKVDNMALVAVDYCKAVVSGFVQAHEKEKSGKAWAVPRVCRGIVPGIDAKKDERYFKAINQIKNKYRYVSYFGKEEIKLHANDTYSLAWGVLNQRKRQYWREEMERSDKEQIAEIERREKEEWPKALADMQDKTIFIDKYMPYGKYVKELDALFIVMPSQRGGFTVTPLKTNTGNYRFNPELLVDSEGCTYVANDYRFLFFDTKEHALAAARSAGKTVNQYIKNLGFTAYREVYGGLSQMEQSYTGNLFQDLISEDIALSLYIKNNVLNMDEMSVNDYRMIQIAVNNNPYLIHSFCVHFKNVGNKMVWDKNASVTDIKGLTENTLWTRIKGGGKWDMGLNNYINTEEGQKMYHAVFPNN